MLIDQHTFQQRLNSIIRQQRDATQQKLVKLQHDIIKSCERRAARERTVPAITFPDTLPISQKRSDIAEAIRNNQVVVIAGETGSGKTTQIPKICLDMGFGIAGMIGCTQPRRIAARALSTRIAEELNTPLGHAVGYKVRFSDRLSEHAYIKIMTDGILLAETQHDPFLNAYEILIIDEAHERSLNIDFLLGYLKKLLPRRKNLKLIISSATIDTERFAAHFGQAPIIEVSGRVYPVDVRYRPLNAESEDEQNKSMAHSACDAVEELFRLGSDGDILIFLSGEREIRELSDMLRHRRLDHAEILPLFARLSAAEQQRIFNPAGRRRIILSTNVAETSLTVPGIRYVIDTGYARISRYSPRGRVQRLPIEKISQAAAEQRKGRCGRLRAGICIRLYSEEDFLARPPYTDPEILRTSLASVILRMKALKLGEIATFPFVQAPSGTLIRDGLRTLTELNALNSKGQLTTLGWELAKFPCDPRIARMILAARDQNCLAEVLVIAAALNIQDPRERPFEAAEQADAAHQIYADTRSDFLGLLKLWTVFHDQEKHLSNTKLRAYCREHFLSYVRMREWREIYQQFYALIKEMGMCVNQVPAEYENIHNALLAGLLSFIAFKTDKYEYLGPHNSKLKIFPGSALFKKAPKWLVGAEIVETSHLYIRLAAKIEPEWAEKAGGHLCRHHYFDPHWEKRLGQVVGYEKVTLYGLTLVSKRSVHYGPLFPAEARKIFIRSALVEGEYETKAPFFHHNLSLINDIEDLEQKMRRPDILVNAEDIYAFYDERIPEGIYSASLFEQWRKQQEKIDPNILFLTQNNLMKRAVDENVTQLFPASIRVNELELKLEYRFEPGEDNDGVTVIVPLHVLNLLTSERFDWLVPGLLKEKIIFSLKALPGSLRRAFVPVPVFAESCVQALPFGAGDLYASLAAHLQKMTGVAVPRDAWRLETLPAHLCMRFRIIEEHGETIAAGRNLAALQTQLSRQASKSFAQLVNINEAKEKYTSWSFGDLPAAISVERNNLQISAFPAIADQGDSVAIEVFDNEHEAVQRHQEGLRRLFLLQLPQQKLKYLEKQLPLSKLSLYFVGLGNSIHLAQQLIMLIAVRALGEDLHTIRTPLQFAERSEQAKGGLIIAAQEVSALAENILVSYHELKKSLAEQAPTNKAGADVNQQLQYLIPKNFLTTTPYYWLQQYPRYLQAILSRLKKRTRSTVRDEELMAQLQPWWALYLKHATQLAHIPEFEQYRWMLEELRVSLFAQELKTVMPISIKRVEKQWALIKAMPVMKQK